MAEIQTNDSEVGLFWSPQATPRPKRPLALRPVSGSNQAQTCRSVPDDLERLLPHPVNTCSRPKPDLRRFSSRTAGFCRFNLSLVEADHRQHLGLNGHWRPAPCAAAVMRIGVVRYYSTEKSDPQSANDRLPKTATHTIDPK